MSTNSNNSSLKLLKCAKSHQSAITIAKDITNNNIGVLDNGTLSIEDTTVKRIGKNILT
jgi:hypothetical protein